MLWPLPLRAAHVPPLTQGWLSQTFVSHRSPVHPSSHVHANEPIAVHEPLTHSLSVEQTSVVHSVPLQPSAQVQVNPSRDIEPVVVHSPPEPQGFELHGSTLIEQSLPVKPCGHVQTKSSPDEWQTPPLHVSASHTPSHLSPLKPAAHTQLKSPSVETADPAFGTHHPPL